MPTAINLQKTPFTYNDETRTFYFTEKYVPFATEYLVTNPNTGTCREFRFSHSTGPEFDPKTQWIYENNEFGLWMSVSNDHKITAANAKAYLEAKVR